MKKGSFLGPTPIKVVFALIFLIPFAAFLEFVLGKLLSPWLIAALIVSYLLSCLFDWIYHRTNNRWIRMLLVVIAVVLSLGAVLLVYIIVLLNKPPVVCDPVHIPPSETLAGNVTEDTQHQICDPVHRPLIGLALTKVYGDTVKVTDEARRKYNDCMKRINRK